MITFFIILFRRIEVDILHDIRVALFLGLAGLFFEIIVEQIMPKESLLKIAVVRIATALIVDFLPEFMKFLIGRVRLILKVAQSVCSSLGQCRGRLHHLHCQGRL